MDDDDDNGDDNGNGLAQRVAVLEEQVGVLQVIVAVLAVMNFSKLPDIGMPANWYLTRYLSV